MAGRSPVHAVHSAVDQFSRFLREMEPRQRQAAMTKCYCLVGRLRHCPRRCTSADINCHRRPDSSCDRGGRQPNEQNSYGFFSVVESNCEVFAINKIDLNALNEQNNKRYRFDTIDPIRIWLRTSLVRI